MRLCVVSPFPPEISGIGQYGWSMVQGLARTNRFRAITVLAGGRHAVTHVQVVARFAPQVEPEAAEVTAAIQQRLSATAS